MAEKPAAAIAEDVFIAEAALLRAIAILAEMTSNGAPKEH
jgi:hypothetical protein